MAGRPRHPKKEVEEAVRYAENKGWQVRMLGHWGRIFCPHPCACQFGVSGTPRDAGNHAKLIVKAVNRCKGGDGDEDV
jgi:hypothetical protein